ncbi:bacterial type II and III secretion system family protein [Collimonas arenae]|uniref:Bacterial type II and III secretion system family protein n=2 Tax=Collimonas arenae TaxID=279058 RepID=A0A127PRN2_9BURK|nr:bacterial type II and III secretion system family protein [Collimonas arenae]AMP10171.1 bacterial type II and III secretion system family protein [Collimonas arenae]
MRGDAIEYLNGNVQGGGSLPASPPDDSSWRNASTLGSLQSQSGRVAISKQVAPIDDEIVMYAGEARVFEVGSVNRIAIGNGKIASTAVIEKTKLLVIAQEVGLTNILLWKKPNLSREIRLRVTALNILKQQRDIKQALADLPNIDVVRHGEKLFVEGSITTREELAKITALTDQYANLVNSTKLDLDVVPAYKQASQMLVFDLYFVEFKKGYLENLGVNWAKSFNGFNIGIFGEATRGSANLRPLPQNSGDTGGAFDLPNRKLRGVSAAVNASIAIPSIIQLAVDSGEAFVLASPSIATRNGGEARFVAGGEVPIPTVSQNGTNVTFKPYGILIEIAPHLDEFGNVTGILKAEVSKIDPSVSVGGIPGFTTRRTETDFSVKTGDAIILSGLYSQDGSTDVQKVPGLGDVPVVGNLFKSTGTTRNQTEVYLVAIPHNHEGEAGDSSNALRNLTNRINQSRKSAGMEVQSELPALQNLMTEPKPEPIASPPVEIDSLPEHKNH